jgi:hypothetical protein
MAKARQALKGETLAVIGYGVAFRAPHRLLTRTMGLM